MAFPGLQNELVLELIISVYLTRPVTVATYKTLLVKDVGIVFSLDV